MGELRVIGRLTAIKHFDVFVSSQRLLFGIEEPGGVAFFPNPLRTPVPQIAVNQHTGERLSGKQHNGSAGLRDTVQLLPHQRQVENRIPAALSGTVGNIGTYQVNGTAGDFREDVEAIGVVKVDHLAPCASAGHTPAMFRRYNQRHNIRWQPPPPHQP